MPPSVCPAGKNERKQNSIRWSEGTRAVCCLLLCLKQPQSFILQREHVAAWRPGCCLLLQLVEAPGGQGRSRDLGQSFSEPEFLVCKDSEVWLIAPAHNRSSPYVIIPQGQGLGQGQTSETPWSGVSRTGSGLASSGERVPFRGGTSYHPSKAKPPCFQRPLFVSKSFCRLGSF